jgi:hypothetical protein
MTSLYIVKKVARLEILRICGEIAVPFGEKPPLWVKFQIPLPYSKSLGYENYFSIYCASKWAVIGWTESMRVELKQALLPNVLFDYFFGEIFGIYSVMDHFTGRKVSAQPKADGQKQLWKKHQLSA